MNNLQNQYWIHGRCIAYSELNYGRTPGFNPVLTQTVTVYQRYDPTVGDFRPVAIPITQILDPFGEVSFHSSQLNHSFSGSSPFSPTNPPIIPTNPPTLTTPNDQAATIRTKAK